jgi:hypothetical protein
MTTDSSLDPERPHWESVWQEKQHDEVSWFQASPEP